MSKNLKKLNSDETLQKPLDYKVIEKLRKKAWADPQVKKNWEEFNKSQQNLIGNNKNTRK